jgi:hypothetical protein
LGTSKDKGKRVTSYGKSIHLRKGAGLLVDSPQKFIHFNEWKPAAYTSTGPMLNDFTYTTTGTAVVNPTILAVGASNVTGGAGGVLRLTTDDVQNTAEEISTPLMATIDTGAPLIFETRLKVSGGASSAFATRESFFGLADALTYTNGQPYTVTAASAITGTNVPTDFCGFAISGVPTSGTLFNTDTDGSGTDGANVGYITTVNNVDTITPLNFSVAGVGDGSSVALGRFAANNSNNATTGAVNNTATYHVYRIEVDPAGVPRFFVDGKYGGKGAALTATVPFGAYFTIISKTASAANTESRLDIDYVYYRAASTWSTGTWI